VIARLLARIQYPLLMNKEFVGNIGECMYYGKAQLQKAMEDSYKHIFIHDEAIDNFNRTFFEQSQIFFVKSSRIIRDHMHVVYMCLPVLWELDRSIRSRVRFYIYVVKRVNLETKEPGIAYVFKRAPGAFVPDPWYLKANQKLEQSGVVHKSPNFRGYIKIPYYEDDWFVKMEVEAQKIKDEKRSEVFNKDGVKQHFLDNMSLAFALCRVQDLQNLDDNVVGNICSELDISKQNIKNYMSQIRLGKLNIQSSGRKGGPQPMAEALLYD
jgi:hypothetical protein